MDEDMEYSNPRDYDALYQRYLAGELPETLAREIGMKPIRLRDKFLAIAHRHHRIHRIETKTL